MNKWQEYFTSMYYNGKMPKDLEGQTVFDLLGQIKESVTVHYPEKKQITVKGVTFHAVPAHTGTYKVTLSECDMPNGMISVDVLASNLSLWISRKYDIETK